MSSTRALYRPSLGLLTDLYQLTMGYGYWKSGLVNHDAAFHLFFRKNPFAGGYTIACGLADAVDLINRHGFSDGDVEYLAGLRGTDDKPLFEPAYLDYLHDLRFTCDVDAIPEGTVVFPHEPLMRVVGPLLQCQVLETALLNLINFQSLIATKSARICSAARGEPVLEFGLRRAQGIDGGVAASRAAYVGGCAATSNVLAGKLLGVPVKGTHAHSWVLCFDTELEAFETYAEAMPNNCVLLVDTYDTIEGVKRAIRVGKKLRQRGHRLAGVRLDSGDLAYLSIEARKLLDAAGMKDTAVVASNDLDEHIIDSLELQGAQIGVWGVGTKLVTAYDQPALGGVYKLAAIRPPGERWRYKVKLSEQAIKTSNPGLLQVRRFVEGNEHVGDMIYNTEAPPSGKLVIVDPMDMTRRKRFDDDAPFEDLLLPIYRGGEQVAEMPDLEAIRARTADQLERFHRGVKRFVNPHQYPVGLELGLHRLKTDLVLAARGVSNDH